jgi:hypothetical protein
LPSPNSDHSSMVAEDGFEHIDLWLMRPAR